MYPITRSLSLFLGAFLRSCTEDKSSSWFLFTFWLARVKSYQLFAAVLLSVPDLPFALSHTPSTIYLYFFKGFFLSILLSLPLLFHSFPGVTLALPVTSCHLLSPLHYGLEQPKIQTAVPGHSLVRSLVRSHRSLVRLLRTACFPCALHCAYSFACSLTSSLVGK